MMTSPFKFATIPPLAFVAVLPLLSTRAEAQKVKPVRSDTATWSLEDQPAITTLRLRSAAGAAKAGATAKAAAPSTASSSAAATASGTKLLSGWLRGPVGAKLTLSVGSGTAYAVTIPDDLNTGYRLMVWEMPIPASATTYTLSVSSSTHTCTVYRGATGSLPTQQPSDIVVGCEYAYQNVSRNSALNVQSTYVEVRDVAIGGDNLYGDGRFVAFVSSANLLGNNPSGKRQVYWYDRGADDLRMVSARADGTAGNGDSYNPSMAPDGLSVAFETYATNLVDGDANGLRDVYRWDRWRGMTWVSANGNGESFDAKLAVRGNIVTFTSGASNLAAGVKGTGSMNVFRRDMVGGTTTLISRNRKGEAVGGNRPAISDDGNRIAFHSTSTDLVPNDKNGLWDIFVYDAGANSISRVSVGAGGTERDQGSESSSRIVAPAISGDGNVVAFATTANGLVPGDSKGVQQVYVVDTRTGEVRRASTGPDGSPANADTPFEQGERPSLSYDGSVVAFSTKAKNLGIPDWNVAIVDVKTGTIKPANTTPGNFFGPPVLSRNAAYVAYPSQAKLANGSSGVFVQFTGMNRGWWWR